MLYDFCVLEFSSLYSDAHCPISLTLRTQDLNLDEISNASNCNHRIRLWNPEKSNRFQQQFNMDKIFEIDSKLSLLINRGSLQQSEMDDIVMQIGQAFEKCAEESFGHVGQEKIKQDMNMTKKPWFKENCFRARNQYHNARRRYNNNKSENNKHILKQASKYYKSTMNFSIKNLNLCAYRN